MSSLHELLEALTPSRDRRLHTRTTLAALTYVELGDTRGGMVLNISEEGMALAVADKYVLGEYLSRIRFPLPISSESFEVSAQIVWLSESKNGAGIRFVDLTPDARDRISHWIKSEKPALEFEQLLKPLRRENRPFEVSSRSSRGIFSAPPVPDEEVAARYAEIFPSESTYAKRTVTLDEIKLHQAPLPISSVTPAGADVSTPGSAAEISTGEVPQSLGDIFPSEHAQNSPCESTETVIPDLRGNPIPERIESSNPATLENYSAAHDGSVPSDQIQSSSPKMVGPIEPQPLEIVVPEVFNADGPSLVEDLHEKTFEHAPIPGFGFQVLPGKIESPPDLSARSPMLFYVPERPAERGIGFQLVAAVCLFAVIGIILEVTGGLGTLGKRFRQPEKFTPAADSTSPAPLDRTGAATSRTSAPPATNALNNPAATVPVPDADVSRKNVSPSETRSDSFQNARHANSASRVKPAAPASAVTTRPNIDSNNASSANKIPDKIGDNTPSEEKSNEVARSSDSLPNPPSNNLNSSSATPPQPSTNPESSPKPAGSDGLIARNSLPAATHGPELPRAPVPVAPITAAPKNAAPRGAAPTRAAASFRSKPPAVLVTPPAEGSNPSKLVFPEKAISVSSSFAISSQLSVLVSPEPGPAAAHPPARLQAGELMFYAEPRFPKPKKGHELAETVKVRATIGQQGQVIDVKPVSGPPSLFPAAARAIREWRYKPTLLNEKPIQFQQDVTIELRPLQQLPQR
jgi:hypothetical protein